MAATFPLNTNAPWTWNGVTYEYNAAEDRWFVVSTAATDQVVEGINKNTSEIDIVNTIIDQEIENRRLLLQSAANKNNEQDERLNEIEDKIDLIAGNIGVLDFAGLFKYMPAVTQEFCDSQQTACLIAAAGDPDSIQACIAEHARCVTDITTEVPEGEFSSDQHIYADVNTLRISNKTTNGADYDWVSLIEPGDYIELVEQNLRDTVLYEVLTDARANSENIRVQYVRQTNLGDSEFNDGEVYAIRVFKEDKGLDINAADARYVKRPYTVMFNDNPPTQGEDFTGILTNGELWFDTSSLELFVWNNNSWVGASPPPSQDITVTSLQAEIATLKAKPEITSSTTAPADAKQGDLWFNPSTLKFAFYTSGSWVNPDQS